MGNRIESAMLNQHLNQTTLSEIMKVTPQAVQQWINGKTSPKGKRLEHLSKALNVSVGWLVSGEGEKHPTQLTSTAPSSSSTQGTIKSNYILGGFDLWDDDTPLRDDEVALPFFREVEIAAGSGRNQVIENHGRKLRFSKATLRSKNVDPTKAACVTVSGNSMEPVIPNGTTIGIDASKKEIVNGEIYALDHDGDLRVKMVYRMPGGVIRLRSFNSDDWPDELYSVDDAAKIKIIGRVFWWSVLR